MSRRRERFFSWLYRRLIRVYPESFRRRYDDELWESGRCLLEDAESSGRLSLGLGLKLVWNTLASALAARWDLRRFPVSPHHPHLEDSSMIHLLRSFCHDLRFAWRLLWKTPGLSLVGILSLALGMGATTAVFTAFNAILLESLPVKNPEELVQLQPRRGDEEGTLSFPLFVEFSEQQQVFEGLLAACESELVRASLGGEFLEGVRSQAVTGGFFSVLGVEPELGRLLNPEDDQRGGGADGPVAVVSHAFWQRQFGASPAVLGRLIKIEDVDFKIVGVAPREFLGTALEDRPDLWLPMRVAVPKDDLDWRTGSFFRVLGRLGPGVGRQKAEAASSLLFRRLLRKEAASGGPTEISEKWPVEVHRIELDPAPGGFSTLRDAYAQPLEILFALVGLVLLIACSNVAGLLLVRGRKRGREIAIRLALGSGRLRLGRQVLTESLLFAALAGGLGLFLASLTHSLLSQLTLGGKRVPLELGLNSRVLIFTGVTCLLTTLLFGSLPAFTAARARIVGTLRSYDGSLRGKKRALWGRLIVTGQLAASLLLLVCAGLLLRSLYQLTHVDKGFQSQRVLLMDVSFDLQPEQSDAPSSWTGEGSARERLARRVHETLNQIPGVESASIAWLGLFSRSDMLARLTLEGDQSGGKEASMARINAVTPDYFRVLGTPLLRGRALADSDTANSTRVAVVNQSFARRFLARGDWEDWTFKIRGGDRPIRVVGIYQDFVWNDLRQDPTPMFFVPLGQLPVTPRSVAVRSSGDPALLASELRQQLRQIDPRVLFRDVKTLEEQVGRSLSREKMLGRLSTLLGCLALFLGAVGLYGLMAFSVADRFREIGIRMALGARRTQVQGMILRDVLLMTAGGIGLGLLLVFWVTRGLQVYLFKLSPQDPMTLGLCVGILLATALLAGWLPARRASELDPVKVLRTEG